MTGPLSLSQSPKLQFFVPGTVQPAAGAKVFTYAAGTMTKQATYITQTGTPNTNPIILDANGECVCYLDSTLEYDFWFSPSTDTDPPTNPYWTVYSVGYGNMINGLAPLNSPAFTGTPTAPTPTIGDNSTNIATTQFVQETVVQAFVNPTATTPSAGDYSTKIATTAFVGQAINTAWKEVVFTSSGTWPVPTNVTWAKFRIWGGGGGGGGGTAGNVGAGGGGAGYAEGTISLGGNTSLAIVIGAAGTAGSAGNPGGAGGASTIAALSITANGGGGGAGNSGTPGAGGSSAGLALLFSGAGGGVTVNAGAAIPAPGGGAWGNAASFIPFGPGCGGTGFLGAGSAGIAGMCIIEYLNP